MLVHPPAHHHHHHRHHRLLAKHSTFRTINKARCVTLPAEKFRPRTILLFTLSQFTKYVFKF